MKPKSIDTDDINSHNFQTRFSSKNHHEYEVLGPFSDNDMLEIDPQSLLCPTRKFTNGSHTRYACNVLVPCKGSTPEAVAIEEITVDGLRTLRDHLFWVKVSLKPIVVHNNDSRDTMTAFR